MSGRVATIKQRLQSGLKPQTLEVVDQSHLHAGHAGAQSGRGHFDINIVTTLFQNLNPIERHRLIYQALGEMMQTDIHALSISAFAPDEI